MFFTGVNAFLPCTTDHVMEPFSLFTITRTLLFSGEFHDLAHFAFKGFFLRCPPTSKAWVIWEVREES